jgi:hypothetical protein
MNKQAVRQAPQNRQAAQVPQRGEVQRVTTKDIVKIDAGILAEVPEYLRKQPGEPPAGLENLERSDMTLPRLGLAQALSPQVSESDPKSIENLRPGMFFNTITREIYGKKVQLVPLLFYKTRILFGSMDEGGGLRCQAPDNLIGIGEPGGSCIKCPFSQFGSARNGEGKGTACNQFFNYAALVVKDGTVSPEQLLVFSLKSSGLKVAKDWNALIRIRNLDIFAGVYELTSVERKNEVGRWYEPVIQPAGNVTPETYEAAKLAYGAVADLQKQGRLRSDVSDLNPEAGGDANEERAPF